MSREAEFDMFVNSGLHGATWPSKACAVIPSFVFGKRFEAVTSADHVHAEVNLIKALRRRIQKQPAGPAATPKKITIYISHSPCTPCGDALIDFYENCKEGFGHGTTMEIVFAALWYIPRPSCRMRGCYGIHTQPHHYTDERKQSISMLKDHPGVTIRPIGSQDWAVLGAELGMDQHYINSQAALRVVEDNYLAQDFQELFGWPMNLEATEALPLGKLGQRLLGIGVPPARDPDAGRTGVKESATESRPSIDNPSAPSEVLVTTRLSTPTITSDNPYEDTLAASDVQDEYSENIYEIETLDNWRTSDKNWRPITGEDETDGWTSLHLACYYDRDHDVDKYVETETADPATSGAGLNDLSIASTSGSSQGLREQGSQDSVGENVDTAPSQPETPPKLKMIKYEYPPSNINTQTEDGETPLFVACERGNARVVRKLLRYKDLIDVNLADNQGKIPLDVAEEMGHIEVVRQLRLFRAAS